MRKPVTPRVSEIIEEWLQANFATKTSGAEYIIDAFHALYRRTLADLKGKFTHDELMLVIDVFNSTALTGALAGQQLDIQVEDGLDLDGLDKKWNISKSGMIDKIKTLTLFEIACLEIWANGFWYGGRYENKGGAIEDHVKRLLEEEVK